MAGDVVAVLPNNSLAIRLMGAGGMASNSTKTVAQLQTELAQAQRAQDAMAKGTAAPGGCCPEKTPWQILFEAHQWGHAFAAAESSAYDGRRANSMLGLTTPTPAVAIGSGSSTGTISVSLPSSTQICWMVCTDANGEDFYCTSLQFNAWEMLRGSPGVTMALFKAQLEQHSMLLPLVGKFWEGTIVISGVFTNLNGSSKIFPGLGIATYNGSCTNWTEKLVDEQGFADWHNSNAEALAHGLAMGYAVN